MSVHSTYYADREEYERDLAWEYRMERYVEPDWSVYDCEEDEEEFEDD